MPESASQGVSAPGGVCSGGVSAPGGVWSGGCLVWGGVCSQGCLVRGCLLPGGWVGLLQGVYGLGEISVWSGGLPQCLLGYHPPGNRMTNRCKNITLATTSLRPVIIQFNVYIEQRQRSKKKFAFALI